MMEKKTESIVDFVPINSFNYSGKKTWKIQLLLIVEFCITIIALFYINHPFYKLSFNNPWMLIFLPISLYSLMWQFLGITTLISTIIYKILVKIERPKEGEFDINGREYKYYIIRFWISYYLLYIARALPLPWVDMFIFPIFGSKIGSNVVLYDCWIDPEFIEIGDSCMISLNTQLVSHCIYNDKFIVKKVVLEKNTIAGAAAIVAPGTYIEEGAILGAVCTTRIGQRLEAYMIHVGSPTDKKIPIKIHKKDEEK